MSDEAQNGGQGGGDGGQGGGQNGAALLNGGGGGGQGGGASWRDALPDDLKSNASLANFDDIAALAKGYVDTKAAATARAVDYTTPEGLKVFTDAVRPADAAAYEISVGEDGKPTALGEAFRAFAHERGIPAPWVKDLDGFFKAQGEAAINAANAASVREVDTLKGQMGAAKFDEKLQTVKAMLPKLGVQLSEEDMNRLDLKIGSGNLLKFMFEVADRVGDPAAIDGAQGAQHGAGALSPAQAQAKWDELKKDAEWRKEARREGTPQNKEYMRLQGIITAGRQSSQQNRPPAR